VKQLTQIGATTDKAISLALQKLGKTREQVDVEVLQEGKRGFLGFGSRTAKVCVTVKEEQVVQVEVEKEQNQTETNVTTAAVEATQNEDSPVSERSFDQDDLSKSVIERKKEDSSLEAIEIAKAYLTSIATELDIHDLKINMTREGKYVIFQLESEKAALLIGKRGQTLNSLQQLTQLVLNKSAKQFLLLKLDVENYRERRQVALEQLADRMADKAIRLNQRIEFEPMQSYERKIIHNQLAYRLDIETYSEGVEPNRYLVIEPVR